MEPLFWIETAGYNLHCAAAYPKKDFLIFHSARNCNSYYRLIEDASNDRFNKQKSVEIMKPTLSSPIFRSLPISIPDCDVLLDGGNRQIIQFNIHMAGLKIVSRVYSEFRNLHSCLVAGFLHISRLLPQLPQNYAHVATVDEIETARKQLEDYLFEICRIRAIAESDLVQDFLSSSAKDVLSEDVDDSCVSLSEDTLIRLSRKSRGDNVSQYPQNVLDILRFSVGEGSKTYHAT